jgi:hypothetical protein
MSPETVLSWRRTGRRSPSPPPGGRLGQAGPAAEGRDLGFDANPARQADAHIAGDRSDCDLVAAASADAHVAACGVDVDIAVAAVDSQVARGDGDVEPAADAANADLTRHRGDRRLSVDLTAGQQSRCRGDIEPIRVAHVHAAAGRVQPHGTESTGETDVARCRAELEIAAGRDQGDDPGVATTPSPARRMSHRDPIARS